jgi:SAM-dependent methyltransferase
MTRRLRRQAFEEEQRFDQSLGIETAGIVRLDELKIDSPNRIAGSRYQATSPALFRQLINRINIDHRQFSFIDFGSGKGRVLMLASEFQFRCVTGVEFSKQLHEIALRNIAAYPRERVACGRLESICIDATEFELPTDPLVLYFYNPFELRVWQIVLARLQRSLERCPRPVYILFIGAAAIGSQIESEGFHRLAEGNDASATIAADQKCEVVEVFVRAPDSKPRPRLAAGDSQ